MGELERLFPILTPIHGRAESHPLTSLQPNTSLSHFIPCTVDSQFFSFTVNAVVPVVLNMKHFHVNNPYVMSNFAISLKKKKKDFPCNSSMGARICFAKFADCLP